MWLPTEWPDVSHAKSSKFSNWIHRAEHSVWHSVTVTSDSSSTAGPTLFLRELKGQEGHQDPISWDNSWLGWGGPHVPQVGLRILTKLRMPWNSWSYSVCLSPNCWDYRHVLCSAGAEPRTLCILGKHPTNWAISLIPLRNSTSLKRNCAVQFPRARSTGIRTWRGACKRTGGQYMAGCPSLKALLATTWVARMGGESLIELSMGMWSGVKGRYPCWEWPLISYPPASSFGVLESHACATHYVVLGRNLGFPTY